MQASLSHDSRMSGFTSGSTLAGSPTDGKAYGTFTSRDDSRVWIPAQHPNRTLVLCFDGTGDHFDSDNSNIVQLVSMLKKDEVSQQLVYYQAGIGTYPNPTSSSPLSLTSLIETIDEMIATSLPIHIKEGYAFLMQNYTHGDKICIFGFSRGAYTARALAGMIQKVGLLPLSNYQQIPFAFDLYKRQDAESLELCEMFKRTFCRDIRTDFLGVWDTVASVGVIPTYLPFISENNGIHYLRHALALDERRIKFLPNYSVDPKKAKRSDRMRHPRQTSASKVFEDRLNASEQETDALEVWFPGVHADVGGGSVKNNTPHALARISLRWMIRECFRCNTGIIFDAVMLQNLGLNVTYGPDGPILCDAPPRLPGSPDLVSTVAQPGIASSLGGLLWGAISYPFKLLGRLFQRSPNLPIHADGQKGRGRRRLHPLHSRDADYKLLDDLGEEHEAEQERKDALSPLYDQLQANFTWRLMEWLPMRVKKQKAIIEEIDSVEGYTWIWNRGRGRKIYKSEMKEGMRVHRSVKTRLEAGILHDGQLYVPKVRPHIAKDKDKKTRAVCLSHDEWNVDEPQHWVWVD